MILKRQVSTRWEKVRAFFGDLAQRAEPEGGFMAIVEVCGMNPWLVKLLEEYGCRNSGEATQRLGSITKRGSKVVRYLLGQAVVKVLRYDMEMRKWYKRIRKRRGSKIARVAVMRRMATIPWHMIKKKQKYEYAFPIKKHREFDAFSGEPQAA